MAAHRCARSPEVSKPPTAQPKRQRHPTERWYRRLPGVAFNQARSRGFSLQSLPGAKVACAFQRWPPLLRLAEPDRNDSRCGRCFGPWPAAASLQGFFPLPVKTNKMDILRRCVSWLSWVFPSWGFPLQCPDPNDREQLRCDATAARQLSPMRSIGVAPGPPLSTSRDSLRRSFSLCLRVSKS